MNAISLFCGPTIQVLWLRTERREIDNVLRLERPIHSIDTLLPDAEVEDADYRYGSQQRKNP